MEIIINMMDHLTKTTEVANWKLLLNMVLWGIMSILSVIQLVKER